MWTVEQEDAWILGVQTTFYVEWIDFFERFRMRMIEWGNYPNPDRTVWLPGYWTIV